MGQHFFGIVICVIVFCRGFKCELEKEYRSASIACHAFESQAITPKLGFRSGETVNYGDFPYMAGISYRPRQQPDTQLKYNIHCGGTLIAAKFVLTVAHCVNKVTDQSVIVHLNVLDFAQENHLRNAISVPIKKVHIHENYSKLSKYNDIAILELERVVEFTANLRPACLYTENDDPPTDKKYYVTGWGSRSLKTHELSTILHKTSVKILPLAQCNATYAEYGPYPQLQGGILETQLCASSEDIGVVAACKGDGGGPLNMVVDDALKIYRVVGIVSASFGCYPEIPTIFTRVTAYLDWIESIVWPVENDFSILT